MTKLLKNLWARLLFQDRGVVPTKRFLILFGIYGAVMVVLAATAGMGWLQLVVTTILLIVLSLIDLAASPRRKDLSFKREMPAELERDVISEVTLTVTNTSNRAGHLIMKDEVHQSIRSALPVTTHAPSQSNTTASYELTAPVRGDYQMNALFVRIASPFKLWHKQTAVPLADSFKVIPDLTDTRHFLENAQQFLLHEGAQVRKMHRGEGEFAQIRNYVVGDDPRKINWHQTAKLRELMTNEHEPEHGKHITLLIDCGRMMGIELSQGNRLEKALEAALTVAAAALKNGDYVGLLAFGTRVQTHVPAAKGMDHMQTILHAIYNLKVEAGESNYAEMMTYLQTKQKKRSLIMLFSDVHTFLHEESALIYLQRLRRRHMFMMIGVLDEWLDRQAKAVPDHVRGAMTKTMAQQQMQIKKQRKAKWERQGLVMIETKEERLAVAAVSNYIRIMNQGLL